MKIISDHIAYLKDNPEGYWFKRKLYGWGWTPVKWQGWLTLLVFVALVFFNATRLEVIAGVEDEALLKFLLQTLILVGLLIAVCYKTGESPRWQWGLPKNDNEKR